MNTKLTIFIHSHLKAFFKTTRLTLISMRLIYDTSASTSLTPEIKLKSKKKIKLNPINHNLMVVFWITVDSLIMFSASIVVRTRQSTDIGEQFTFLLEHMCVLIR